MEPKVFFANERTFLAWMHISIILAGASIAIMAFSGSNDNPASQLYGVVMLPVAIAFIVYSMYQCEYFSFGGSGGDFVVVGEARENYCFIPSQRHI